MPNAEALKLPDPLLVRYYREGRIEKIAKVAKRPKSRDLIVTLRGGAVERWQYLTDLGWIPDAD